MLRSLKIKHYFFLWLLLSLGVACKPTKHLQEGEYLLVKNNLELNPRENLKNKAELKEGLAAIVVQQPNKRLIGMLPLRLWFFNAVEGKKINKFRNWMRTKVGEAPVILDERKAQKSADLMQNYLFNTGYLDNSVRYSIDTLNQKKARVNYEIIAKKPFIIKHVIKPNPNTAVEKIIQQDDNSLLKPGKMFSINMLKAEQSRLTNLVKDNGFFYFNKQYITFYLDSAEKNQNINIYVNVSLPIDSSNHKKYSINQVYVYTDYLFRSNFIDSVKYDSLLYKGIYFLRTKQKIRPSVLYPAIGFQPGETYSISDHRNTVQKLSNLGVFKYVSINYTSPDSAENSLDVHIYLTPSKKQSYSFDLEANNNFEGLLGTGISFSYQNKNISKGADNLKLSLSTGVELQFFNKNDPDVPEDQTLLNTADVSGEVIYTINRFLIPFRIKSLRYKYNPKTKFSLNYRFEDRFNYYRLNATNFSFGYVWKVGAKQAHAYTPVSISLVNIPRTTQAFIDRLNEIPSLKSSFQEQLIPGSNYTYVFSNQGDKENRFSFFQGSVDLAGNLVEAFNRVNKPQEENYQLFNINYSQFIKFDADLRFYYDLRNKSTLAFRLYNGIGVPYGNSDVLPYVKQYFVGGANSMRAFRVRSIGPGAYFDSTAQNRALFLDQTGDMRIEGNLEYRFNIFRWIDGATFLDVGNIWLIKEDSTRENVHFSPDRFIGELGVGTGLGMRLDFDYFVLRFDLAFPLRDPRRSINERWVLNDIDLLDKRWRQDNLIFNLAIGYPF